MLADAFGYLLCFKLCWHNQPGPNPGSEKQNTFADLTHDLNHTHTSVDFERIPCILWCTTRIPENDSCNTSERSGINSDPDGITDSELKGSPSL